VKIRSYAATDQFGTNRTLCTPILISGGNPANTNIVTRGGEYAQSFCAPYGTNYYGGWAEGGSYTWPGAWTYFHAWTLFLEES
jgi:hypothetical protein